MIEKEIIKKRIGLTILVALILPMMMFISIPLELYSKNLDEFIFNLQNFVPWNILFAFILFVINFFVLIFLPHKAYKIMCSIFLSLTLLFFIQGTFLNGQFNSLAGDNLGVARPPIAIIVFDVLLWAIVIGGGIWMALIKDKKEIVPAIFAIISITMIVTHFIIPFSVLITNPKVFETKETVYATDKNLDYISNNKNIFYFIVDRFDEVYAEEAISKDPNIYDKLKGFTWFKDNISIYGHTFPAIANMLTMKDHDLNNSRVSFLNNVYTENDTLSVLSENGYEINLFTDAYYAYDDAKKIPNYVSNVINFSLDNCKVEHPLMLSLSFAGISLYRCLPFGVKDIFKHINSYLCNNQVSVKSNEGYSKYSCENDKVYEYVKNATLKSKDSNMFNFIHFTGCHDVAHSNTYNAVKLSFEIINKYIDAMKTLNVYDDATIIITGDHSAPYNDLTDVLSTNQPRLTALFVKNGNCGNADLKQSMAQTSHDNIWATIMKSQGIVTSKDYGLTLFEIPENVNQNRRYIWQTYGSHVSEYKYIINGPGRDMANWKEISRHTYNKFLID